MAIAHISDIHLRTDGRPIKKTVDSPAALDICARYVRSLSPRPAAVLVTGDLAHTATNADYLHLRRVLDGLGMPVYAVPGNMDDRQRMRQAFAGWGYLPEGEGFLHYAIEDHPLRLIGLDTRKGIGHGGRLCAERLAWLEARLGERPDTPTLLFMHHPPVETDAGRPAYQGAAEMAAIVARHRQVARIACGHLHERTERRWAGSLLTTAASVTMSRLDVPASAPLDADACLVYAD